MAITEELISKIFQTIHRERFRFPHVARYYRYQGSAVFM